MVGYSGTGVWEKKLHLHAYLNIHMHVTTIDKNELIILKESNKGYTGNFGGRKKKTEMV